MDSELGYISTTLEHSRETVYLYIKDRRVVGCITAIAISTAYNVIPDRGESAEEAAATFVKEERGRATTPPAPAASSVNPLVADEQVAQVARSPKEKKNKKLRGLSTSLIERIREKDRQRKALLELEAVMAEVQAAKKKEKEMATSVAHPSDPQTPSISESTVAPALSPAPAKAGELVGAVGAAAAPKLGLLPTSSGLGSGSGGGNSVCRSTLPQPAQCGISRLWVHRNHRRKNIATKILDTIR